MRKLGQELGVEAMSLYTHVRDKDDLLDGMVDAVVGEIPIDRDGRPDWQADPPTRRSSARATDAPPPVGAADPRDAERARAGDARLHGRASRASCATAASRST